MKDSTEEHTLRLPGVKQRNNTCLECTVRRLLAYYTPIGVMKMSKPRRKNRIFEGILSRKFLLHPMAGSTLFFVVCTRE